MPTEPDRLDELNQELLALKYHNKMILNANWGWMRIGQRMAAAVADDVAQINAHDKETAVSLEETQKLDNGKVKGNKKEIWKL